MQTIPRVQCNSIVFVQGQDTSSCMFAVVGVAVPSGRVGGGGRRRSIAIGQFVGKSFGLCLKPIQCVGLFTVDQTDLCTRLMYHCCPCHVVGFVFCNCIHTG